MVLKKIMKYDLLMCYKHLPEDVDTVGFYFLKTTTDPIQAPSSLEKAQSVMPSWFETGSIDNKPLVILEKMLSHVYIPMLMLQGMYE